LSSLTTIWSEALAEEAPAREAASRFYHPELDILRFFAFFAVFCHHALPREVSTYAALHVPPWLGHLLAGAARMGAFGVDIFFVLSSFLITELLLREKSLLGEVDVRSFYARRVLRIWPLYFAFLLLAAAMQLFVPGQHIGWRAAMGFTFLAGNWWIVFHGFPSSVIFPLWSISIEEQFYLLWPAVVKRAGTVMMLALTVCMLALANATRLYLGLHHAMETQAWCNTLVHLDPIAAGILIAVLLKGRTPAMSVRARPSLAIAGIALLWAAANFFRIKADPLKLQDLLLGYPVMAAGASALLIAMLCSRPILDKSSLVYLGRISYGLYVFHVLALMCSDYLMPNFVASAGRLALHGLVALTLTVALAATSYRWLETPFLKLKQRFTHVLSRAA
jgi:peptidoglycan/LPS O-acetylase OafA/YrhL